MIRMSFSGCVSERGGDLRNAVNTAALDEAVRRFPALLHQCIPLERGRFLASKAHIESYEPRIIAEYRLIVGKEGK